MNKNRYRVIFNKARSQLMVVAETARVCQRSAPAITGKNRSKTLISRLTSVSFALLLAAGAISQVQAGVVANGAAPGSQQPTIINSANGIPQVNIQAPSAAGVSHNRFSQFDVGQRGMILNNSHKNVRTELAGMVAKNPWLAKSEARIILNEVNSRDPSRLNGFIEVAGRKAEVIIANPAGITCNGCGFINANRATLTTGQPLLQNGKLLGYQVERGGIAIEGAGMDSSRQDYTDIIARSVKINAHLMASDLRITTGRNQVDAANQRIKALQNDGSAKPKMALDVSSLGGMYAGKIRMIGTERGVGVNNAGEIGALAGNIILTADGSIKNSGTVYASKQLAIHSHADLDNSGSLSAGSKLIAQAQRIHSSHSSRLVAGLKQKGAPLSEGEMILSSREALSARGQNLSGGKIILSGKGVTLADSLTMAKNISADANGADLRTDGASVLADQNLVLKNSDRLNNDRGTLSASKLTIAANSLSNRAGTVQQTGDDDLNITLASTLNNQHGTLATNSHNLTLSAAEINNRAGNISHAGKGELHINSPRMQGEHGRLQTGGKLVYRGDILQLDNAQTTAAAIDIETGSLSHRHGEMKQFSPGSMAITTRQTLDNQYGALLSNGDITLNSAQLDNQYGRIASSENGSLSGRISGQLDNRHGQLAAARNIILSADSLDNRDSGEITASNGNLRLHAARQLLNHQGQILTNHEALISGGGFNNQSGLLGAQNLTLNFAGSEVNNQQGEINALSRLDLRADSLNNQQGLIRAGTDLGIQGASALTINNHQGNLAAGRNLTVEALALSGNGNLLANNDIQVKLQQNFDNQAQVKAAGSLAIESGGTVTNSGVLHAGKALTLNAQTLDNQQTGEIRAEHAHLLLSGDATNRGLIDGQLTHINAANIINSGGRLYGDHIALSADSLTNQAEDERSATLAARNRLDIGVNTLSNLGHSLIYSVSNIAMGASLDTAWQAIGRGITLTNRGATIQAGDHLQLSMAQINNLNNKLELSTSSSHSYYHEARLSGSGRRYDWSRVDISQVDKDGIHTASMPDGSSSNDFYEYNYTRTTDVTRLRSSDPGLIAAGGDITFNSKNIHNSDSHVIAGGSFDGTLGNLNNEETHGVRVVTESGTQTHWFARDDSRWVGQASASQGTTTSDYNPTPESHSFSLDTLVWQSHNPDAAKPGDHVPDIGPSYSDNPPVVIPAGQRWEISPPAHVQGAGPDEVIKPAGIETRLPDDDLFITPPASSAHYVVETDPGFTDEKRWLSSDYMMKQFVSDPGNVHKRLSEGYYQQNLVRNQLIALTGHQLLAGYKNDEEQFKALMDAGIRFSQQHRLQPGVALSAKQMAQLTSDIVWMVEKKVRLADGSWQKVLVPQVYLKVNQAELDNNGNLGANKLVRLDVKSDSQR
ncbi:hypothetical protein BL250_09395 [Erwinia sp. OLTSP20]|uniref:two-partner secretion domain-containing protein n=1 Tax=unclassified Erwinia TaxID=2622719 RepID=UPI000C17A761|nr:MULTISPECIES: filamentous hemagglutinin N-terminal domain-containing protein [unclassified Erwinia]PIJ50740.1 hypothetical protein BV501_07075 [Erwinia sp. OAMSP11]PIJ75409.1 hypothetical protein BK416_01870 [Erwinia sp. OLSSP12]PIJ81907.1 hypothetical protein BLD47_07420 [Erwinia sp. OLCASP19]PIJ84562.1 hypothetical protein BLD46_07510 [Erwinia sp. OLMTSP26]PIJ86909.1 hypothetical protein BLD49_07280 [Erwinia sp. OLMDSP33]